MKVFVASSPQGDPVADDFCFTVDGELVWSGFGLCDCPDCGCERSMAGVASSKATTTFRVHDDPAMTPELYRQASRDVAVREGWITEQDEKGLAEIDEIADAHRELARAFVANTELRRVGDRNRLLVVAVRTD